MHLGGWTRLGIVVSIVYGAVVGFIAYDDRPRLEYMQKAWIDEAAEVIAEAITNAKEEEFRPEKVFVKLLKNGQSGVIEWLEKVAVSPTENQKIFSSTVSQVNSKHRMLIANLPQHQREHWLMVFAWWAGGTVLLFATGWAVRWVYQGFRRNAV